MLKNTNGQKILVVDDEELIIEFLNDYFKELGYDVTIALSTEEAIEKLAFDNQYNLIITDIDLPGKSGFELLKIVKETKENLPVVILSGINTLDNTIKAIKNGATDFISKPFDIKSVQKVVEKILKKQVRSAEKEQIFTNLNILRMSFEFTTIELNPDILASELANILQKMNFSNDNETKQFELIFLETLINAIEHGNLELSSSIKDASIIKLNEYEKLKERRLQNPCYSNRKIFVELECSKDRFCFKVEDRGKGFNWKNYVNPSFKLSNINTESYGRGFNIIHHIIDEVQFNKDGNQIILIKESSNLNNR
jgi:DNA-binding response OmpR family regulator